MTKMWKKSEIKNYRSNLILGATIPFPNSTEIQRRLARAGAIYALGKILGMEDVKTDE